MGKKHPLEAFREGGSRYVTRTSEAPETVGRAKRARKPARRTPDRSAGGRLPWAELLGRLRASASGVWLAGLGAALVLVLAVFAGYKWGFHSGRAIAFSEDTSRDGAGTSLQVQTMWTPASESSAAGDGEAGELPEEERVSGLERGYAIQLVTYASDKKWLAEEWEAKLLNEGFPYVEAVPQSERVYLFCGKADTSEELDELLERVQAYRDDSGRPFETATIKEVTFSSGS